MSDARPIGVFDSGIGGLTVLRSLRERLPHENFVYLGDTARVPYGTKGSRTVQHFAAEATVCLLQRGVKAVVLACNTASAVALETVREVSTVPVFGVIEPGVEAALERTRGCVGVIGTLATVGSDRYGELLRQQRPDLEVHSRACPLFVPLAEEGWVDDPIMRTVAERYLRDLREAKVDTLILGCTHYPILKHAIGQVMGEDVHLVDSALVLSAAVAAELERREELRSDPEPGTLDVLVSDVPQRFSELSERFLSLVLQDVELVDLEAMPVPDQS